MTFIFLDSREKFSLVLLQMTNAVLDFQKKNLDKPLERWGKTLEH